MKSNKEIKKLRASLGSFYTGEVQANIMRQYLPENVTEVYDPTCGYGSLLSVFPDTVKKYGIDIDLDAIQYAQTHLTNATIVHADTLQGYPFGDKRFDCIIANPPFSIAWNPNKNNPAFSQAPVLAPASKADYAFVLHCLYMLSEHGTAAVLQYPGVAYRGNAEGKIRQWIVEQNYIDKVVYFQPNLFEDTSISTLLFILRKDKIDTDITFIDNETQTEYRATFEEVKKNCFSLSKLLYLQQTCPREEIDIEAVKREIQRLSIQRIQNNIAVNKLISMLEENPRIHTDFLADIRDVVKEEITKQKRMFLP